MKITKTKHGLRLSQHGIVISELRTTPGPTHSVFDVLAALIAVFAPAGRVGMLGFAGGGMIAPLRFLGVNTRLDAVDLDRRSYQLFRRHCPEWARSINWHQADAAVWLQAQPRQFDLLLDDLSVPSGGDVVKPDISWETLPGLIHQRLRPGGIGLFNLLPPAKNTWATQLARVSSPFRAVRLIHLKEFENRILVCADHLPSARELSAQLGGALRRLRSRQAGKVRVRGGGQFGKET